MHASRLPGGAVLARWGMRALFDGLAPVWDRVRDDPVYLAALATALDSVPSRLGPSPVPEQVLDVGCGSGIATRALLERFPAATVVGLDISPRMVALAREQVPRATFEVGDGHALPFEDASFDLVVALDGVFSPRELGRVCAPGGNVVVVYSRGADIPVRLPTEQVASELEREGLRTARRVGSSWVVWGRAPDAG